MTYEKRLKEIEDERHAQLETVWAAQDRIRELNIQRQNLIMSEDEGDVEN